MELVADVHKVGARPRSRVERADAEVFPRDHRAPPRMNHTLITAEEVGESTQFYRDVLGFRITEQPLDGNGHQVGTWMERSHSPHDLAVVQGPTAACTTSRTGSTTGTTCAMRQTSWRATESKSMSARRAMESPGARQSTSSTRSGRATRSLPVYTDLTPDFPTLTWTGDNVGRAIFYYEGELNDRFMKVHT